MSRDPFSWLHGAEPQTPEDALAANETAMRDAAERAINEARKYYDVFNTAAGRELLAMLRDCTIEVPLIRVSGTVGGGEISMTGTEWAFFREGQNSVVRHIELQMQIAVTPLATEGNENGREN